MCEPITGISATAMALYIGAAVTVASTAATLYAQSEQADAQQQYQEDLMDRQEALIRQNYALAEESAEVETAGVQRNFSQIQDQTFNEQEANAIEARQARATAITAAGEAGVGGGSVRALLNDFYRQEATFRRMSDDNLRYSELQLRDDEAGIIANKRGRQQSIQPYIPEPVSRPNYLGEGLKLGANVAGQYGRLYGKKHTG